MRSNEFQKLILALLQGLEFSKFLRFKQLKFALEEFLQRGYFEKGFL